MGFVILFFVIFFTELFIRFHYRTKVVQRAKELVNATHLPEWKAWRLSALEPFITTALTLIMVWGYFVGLPPPFSRIFSIIPLPDPFLMVFIVPMLSMLLFALLIRVRGKGCRRGRLVNTVIFTRLLLLLIPLFLVGQVTMKSLAMFVAPAFLIRMIFGLYQRKVTPTLHEFLETQIEAQLLTESEIEDDVILSEDNDLWDEQVALIERLKAEEVTAEAQTVGRAQELL